MVALFGGYLMDLLGRRGVLVWSILLYGLSACAAAFCRSLPNCCCVAAHPGWRLRGIRRGCRVAGGTLSGTEAPGIGAWLHADVFQLGRTDVTGAYFLAVTFAQRLPAISGGHAAWRYTLLTGLIPALPLLIVRPFLPESRIWQEKKLAGTSGVQASPDFSVPDCEERRS